MDEEIIEEHTHGYLESKYNTLLRKPKVKSKDLPKDRDIILKHVKRIETIRKLTFLQKGKSSSLDKLQKKNYRWWQRMACEPKIDGIRAVFYDNQFITFSQKRIYNCEPIIREIKRVIKPHEVLDGELYGKSWEHTQSVVMSSVEKKRLGGVKFLVFDCIPRFEFERGVGTTTQEVRDGLADDFIKRKIFKHVQAVPSYRSKNFTMFKKHYDQFVDDGYEGAMLKNLDSPYLFYKGDAWMKFKHTETEDVTVVGFKPGKGKYAGVLGSFICEDERGNKINVSGMNDHTRKIVWKSRKKHLGKIVEVKFYKLTEGGKMYSAQFLRWREDK